MATNFQVILGSNNEPTRIQISAADCSCTVPGPCDPDCGWCDEHPVPVVTDDLD